MITGLSFKNVATGVRTTIKIAGEHGTHKHLAVFRRYVRTDPLYDGSGVQIGWHTKPADWYLAWGYRTRYGNTYRYDGLENERGFRTRKEATARKKEIESNA